VQDAYGGRHPDATINGKTFSGITEIRIEER
jgi:hypothetical protein